MREHILLWRICMSLFCFSQWFGTLSGEAAFDKILEVNEQVARIHGKFNSLFDARIPDSVMGKAGDRSSPIRDRTGLWHNGIIPYTISFDLTKREEHIKVLKNAMKEWENKTCIRFKKRENDADYVEFYYGDGCNSDVGRVGGRQSTSLGQGCADHGIVVHEIGHLVGFWHEQNRPDRDEYVEIQTNNILRKFRFAFQKYSEYKIDSLGVEYDYQSVMHYGPKAFSRNRRDTIVSKNKTVTKFGNNHLSPLDIKQANLLYRCSDRKKVEVRNPKFPEDFMWRSDGPSSLFDCVQITEPKEGKFWWDDNYFCVRKGTKKLGLRWSHQGAIPGMTCILISEPRKKRNLSWNNNYLCVNNDSPLTFKWNFNGPISNMKCIEWNEPSDYYFRDNYLCAKPSKHVIKIDGGWSEWSSWQTCSAECGGGKQKRTRTCTNPSPKNGGLACSGEASGSKRCNLQNCPSWPAWPDDFSFFSTYSPSPADKHCSPIYERFEYLSWVRVRFCSEKNGRKNPGMRWSDEGKVPKMRCCLINEPDEKTSLTWNDNYLCMPKDAPYRFLWSHRGKIPGFECIQWKAKNGRNGWDNNYLCSLPYRPNKKSIISTISSSQWSSWSEWSECSLDCGGGTQKRTRSCTKARSISCVGSSIEERFCNVAECQPCGEHSWQSNGQFRTPGYPSRYPKKTSCIWTISAPIEKRIRMRFNQFDLPGDGSNCDDDYVIIRDGSTSSSPLLGKFCGKRVPPLMNSRTSSLWIMVKTSRSKTHKGFEAEWTNFLPATTAPPTFGHGCGGLLTSHSGRFTTPNYPNPYPPGRTCIWIIQVQANMTVNLRFNKFFLEPHQRCGYDHVEIRDGATETSPPVGIYCGSTKRIPPQTIESFGNSLWIKFRSDASTTGKGFEAFYMARSRPKKDEKDKNAYKACPTGWKKHNDGKTIFCYAIRKSYKNWYDAQKDCQVLGSNLLSLTSKNEQSFVTNELLADTYLWLGLTDKAREGVWAWSDKPKRNNIQYQNWAGGDPNDGGYFGNEDCAVMKPDGKWNDYPCNQRFKYICKRSALIGHDVSDLKGLAQARDNE